MIILLALSQLTQGFIILPPDLDGSCTPLTFQRIVNVTMLNVVVQRMDYYNEKMSA